MGRKKDASSWAQFTRSLCWLGSHPNPRRGGEFHGLGEHTARIAAGHPFVSLSPSPVGAGHAQVVMAEELPGGLRLPDGVTTHGLKSMNAPFASGSNPVDVMVVVPCTMGTLGRIAHGSSEDVLLRAADGQTEIGNAKSFLAETGV